jgi:Arylsulfotransferase (ASST)
MHRRPQEQTVQVHSPASNRILGCTPGGASRKTAVGEIAGRAALLIASGIMVFIAGAALMYFGKFANYFPANFLRDAFSGGRALFYDAKQMIGFDPPYERLLYGLARHTGSGVTLYNKDRTFPGLTLFISGHAQSAFLMGMDGKIVHEWHYPFSKAWKHPEHIAFPVGDEYIYFRKPYVFPNGDLLTMYEAPDTTPFAYGLIKLDKDSNLLWKNADYVHHDFDIAADGTIYALTMRVTNAQIPGGPRRCRPPFLEDGVSIFSPDGRLLKQVFLFDAFARSDYRQILSSDCGGSNGSFFHANGIDIARPEIVAKHPYVKSGQLLLSLHHGSTLAVLDVDSQRIVWALRGSWRNQHDSDFLPNGNLLLFDNTGNLGRGGASRVLEVNPLTEEIVWSYRGNEKDLFFSPIRSSQQRLPNGNTLITESDQGRIIEVTPSKEICWEYINPHRAGPKDEYIAVIDWAQRIDPATLWFLKGDPKP